MGNFPRSGYTLPVFACAAAVAALRHLQGKSDGSAVAVDLVNPAETVTIEIEGVASLKPGVALAIARSDPGDNLDLTRNTPIWAMVEFDPEGSTPESITLVGGEGLGRNAATGEAAIYAYAKQLFRENLERYLKADDRIQVTIILPEGRSLAMRTSNAAFGIVEGLSLLGTRGISQPLSAPEQLEIYREEVRIKARQFETLVFCIGENGWDLARKMGVEAGRLVKIANWIGPLLVEAGLQSVKSIVLLGYHGKLVKLAGGIFHTHHDLADGRLEILTAHCAHLGIPTAIIREIFACATAEDALQHLRQWDAETGTDWTQQVYREIAETIDRRAGEYIAKHCLTPVSIGSILFDRQRQIIVQSTTGSRLWELSIVNSVIFAADKY
jgi:cobalt-precorrin-5B (C1)-methyltransferase